MRTKSFQSRFTRANIRLKEAISGGRFGRLALGDTYVKWWRTQQYYDSGGWRGTWELDGGGALMNQAIHNVDLRYWLMGDVESIVAQTATLAHSRIEVEDTAVANLRFKNGALGTIEAATSAYPGLLKRTEIHGDRLLFRGHDAVAMAKRSSFEAVAELLWTGTLPPSAIWPEPPQGARVARTATAGRARPRLNCATAAASSPTRTSACRWLAVQRARCAACSAWTVW